MESQPSEYALEARKYARLEFLLLRILTNAGGKLCRSVLGGAIHCKFKSTNFSDVTRADKRTLPRDPLHFPNGYTILEGHNMLKAKECFGDDAEEFRPFRFVNENSPAIKVIILILFSVVADIRVLGIYL
ncbi:hypothetical protein C1646_667820 [Rhizophagus diaphanus]|nr:hypothetical protein C1646_667820 [Rhizophagus diaphanus] [Rhizophagus sp. MUCL 43196]